MKKKLEIIDYEPRLAELFFEINAEWISSMFKLEPKDLESLKNPDDIINTGGKIWFVSDNTHGIVGTCALIKDREGNFELSKMGVLQKARGLGAGEKLLKHIVEFVRTNELNCYLLTNKRCESAIHLYKKLGFEHDADILKTKGELYQRFDVGMILVTPPK